MTTSAKRPRAKLPSRHESEAGFQAAVIELATLAGWLTHHEYDSRRSSPGYPDLTLVKPPRVIFAELKTARGRVRLEQRRWLDALARCPGVEAVIWRPQDWPAIVLALWGDANRP